MSVLFHCQLPLRQTEKKKSVCVRVCLRERGREKWRRGQRARKLIFRSAIGGDLPE